jgi:hypothetical protein
MLMTNHQWGFSPLMEVSLYFTRFYKERHINTGQNLQKFNIDENGNIKNNKILITKG